LSLSSARTDSSIEREAWRPLLGGQVAKQAGDAIEAVAREIPKSADSSDASLAGGTAGLGVLYGYLSEVDPRSRYRERATRFLERAADAVASVTMSPALFGGFSGVAWAMRHLEGRVLDRNGGSSTAEVDRVLRAYVSRPGWVGEYDLVSGLVGLGVYALERLPAPAAIGCLEGVVDRLAEIATRRDGGNTWLTPPEILPDWQRRQSPRGYYNLGLAHGVPGVIVVLGAACAAGIRPRKARKLLDGAVAWLLRQERTEKSGSRFSSWSGFRSKRESCRSAWCYGDPGVAAALFSAARSVGESEWERKALEIARGVARSVDRAGVVDAGLCHGAAGLGHLFNRMYQATRDEDLGETARFWFERALEMRQPGRGIGGFRAQAARENGARYWEDEEGILTGASGIALALLAATTSVEPEWDRMLLLSTRTLQ
jgi:lantibiotic biosynthesis protein